MLKTFSHLYSVAAATMGLFGLRWTSAREGALRCRVSWRRVLVLGSVLAMAAALTERSMVSVGASLKPLSKLQTTVLQIQQCSFDATVVVVVVVILR